MNNPKMKPLTNSQKTLVLKLLEDRRFSILQHWRELGKEVDPTEGKTFDQYLGAGMREAIFINQIIEDLELKVRPTELKELI